MKLKNFNRVTFERIQGGSRDNIDTHQSKYFQKIIKENINGEFKILVDPFSRNCSWPQKNIMVTTNDINPETSAMYHMDALDFLSMLPSNFADVVVFDPPFSRTQNKRKYGEIANVYTKPGYVKKCMLQISRILVLEGKLIKFGYNSTRHLPEFKMQKLYLVNFGGNRNDVIVSIWQNTMKPLTMYNKVETYGWK